MGLNNIYKDWKIHTINDMQTTYMLRVVGIVNLQERYSWVHDLFVERHSDNIGNLFHLHRANYMCNVSDRLPHPMEALVLSASSSTSSA